MYKQFFKKHLRKLLFILAALLLVSAIIIFRYAKKEPEVDAREVTISSFYDESTGLFSLDGLAAGTNWKDVITEKELGIDMDSIVEEEYGFSLDKVLFITDTGFGYIHADYVRIAERNATLFYYFDAGKLNEIKYSFDFEDDETSDERNAFASKLVTLVEAEYGKYDRDRYEDDYFPPDSILKEWFRTGKDGETVAMLSVQTSIDSVSGEVYVSIGITCDIPENKLPSELFYE